MRWPRGAAVAFCALLGSLLPAAHGTSGMHEPGVHDEFSYLLAADTFAHGRLTNPAPRLPEFFEAPHILVTPTYTSKYPPAQALALALGQSVCGHPLWGVWLSCGLFAASLCWMLQAWTRREWALATAIVAIVTLGITDYWAQSYWGGMLAAGGGALVFGAMRRTCRSPRITQHECRLLPPSRRGAAVDQAGRYAAGVTGSTIHNMRAYLQLKIKDIVAARHRSVAMVDSP